MYRMIIVDDEPWALTGLEEILPWGDYGFEIIGRCTSGAQALREIGEKQPDAVFTDIRMPKIGGMELISQVRDRLGLNVEFVIISAYSDFEVARKAINYGAAGYVLKPLEREEVAATVLRLKARLDQKRSPGPLALDPGDPESLREAAASLPAGPGGDARCYVLITEAPPALPPGSYVPLEPAGIRQTVCYCTVPPSVLNLLPSPAGWSLPRSGPGELGEMLREAQAAFLGGFTYSTHPTIAAIQVYLGENFGQNLTLGHLAAHFFLSETYLCELFKKNTGCTVMNFLISVRLENACRLLRENSMSIKEIASTVGFNDYSYFGRIFRRNLGRTPDQYRAAWETEDP